MKKIFMLLVVVLGFTTQSYAQLIEVRGVETRWTSYDGPRHYSDSGKAYMWKGCEFSNLNNFSVSVDAELWRYYYLRDVGYNSVKVHTKTFVLKPQETFLWKYEADRLMWGSGIPNLFNKDYSSNSPEYDYGFYVVYKAYKFNN